MGPVRGPPYHRHCPGHTGNGPWMPRPPQSWAAGRGTAPDTSRPSQQRQSTSTPPDEETGCPPNKREARGGGGRLTPQRASERPAEPAEQCSTPARGANVQGPSPTPSHPHGTCSKTGPYRHRTATGGPDCIPCSQAQRYNNGGAHRPTQNAPLIPDAARGARGHQGAGTPRWRQGPPPRGRGGRPRPGDDPRGPRRQRARGARAASRQRARPLPRVEAGPLHRGRLVLQATPPTRRR